MSRVDLSFVNNIVSIYKYEPFFYRITKPVDTSGISATVSSGIPTSFLDVSSPYSDLSSATGYNGGTSTVENWIVNALDSGGNTIRTSSNAVSIYPGRFVDSSSNSMLSNSFTFYLKEPFSPVLFKSFINLQSPLIVSPTLPPGISFVASGSSNYNLTASPSPAVVLPTTNYQIIGKGTGVDLGKIVTTRINIVVSNERVLLDLSGSSIVGPMTIGNAISNRQVTARYPPYATPGSNMRYTWSGLPDGLTFAKLDGTPVTSPYIPQDPSSSIVLKGAPTVAAANAFRDADISSSTTITLTGTRTIAPTISTTQPFSFSFVRSILFDSVAIPTFFTDVSLNPTTTSFRAKTYFFGSTDSSISTIFSPDLRHDLSLVFVSNQQRAYLTGEPSNASNGYYTITASNTLGDTRDISVNIVSSDISMSYDYSVTPSNGTAYTFVVSRPLSNALPGYYTSPILFKASNSANLPMAYTATSLPIGVSLSNIGGNVVQLVGSPGAPFSLAQVDISATVIGTSNSQKTRVDISTIADAYTFNNVTPYLTFIQNRAITPFQISATTLSERPVIQYGSLDIPANLTMSARGIVSGTDISSSSGTFNVTASTGYTLGVKGFPYTVIKDEFLLFVEDPTYLVNPEYFNYSITPGSPVTIPIRGISFSGIPVNRFSIVDTPIPSCPFTIDSTTGVITAKTGVYVPPSPSGSPYTYTILAWSASTPVEWTPAGELVMTLSVPIGDLASTLQFSATSIGGPVFTSPTADTFLVYQYVPITPIVLAATGSTPIKMYVSVGDLPIGLVFDPATQTISGTPAFVGYQQVVIYAQDVASRYTSIVLGFNVILPRVVRQQTSAGGYTSLLRQYTNVNAAQNARDNKVKPTEVRSLGEFMSPVPPDLVTAPPPCLTVRKTVAADPFTLPNYYRVGQTFWSAYWSTYLNQTVASNSTAIVTATTDNMNVNLTGQSYAGGVLAPNGKIYGIPFGATDILIINPATGTAERNTMQLTLPITAKWFGGVLAPNGKIYGIPYTGTNILIIDPRSDTASLDTMNIDLSQSVKWAGGVLAPNGKIYCIPYSGTDILIIDPATDTARRDAMGLSGLGAILKWAGGVLAPNGKIYGIPHNSSDVLIIDPATDTATRSAMGLGSLGSGQKWNGGVLAPNGKIYGIPYSGTDILIIDPATDTARRDAMNMALADPTKWRGGVLAPNGKIYCMPYDSTSILVINPATDTASITDIASTFTGTSKWAGGVLAPNGKIYGMRYTAATILQITTTPTPTIDSALLLTPYFNKF